MKKTLLLMSVILLVASAAYSQEENESPLPHMDAVVRDLSGEINKKFIEVKAQKIFVGQFSHQDSIPQLSSYWTNQIIHELTNTRGRSFIILDETSAGADWTISGEIVVAADVVRVYTRLVRAEDRAIEASFISDFERQPYLAEMLSSGGSSSSSAARDAYEPDSWDNPASYEIGDDENCPVMNRTIHNDEDEDFFLLEPDRSGRMTMETTGSLDTYMYFYDYDSRDLLEEDDDGGSSLNARIRMNVQAGKRYLVKVQGYGSGTGSYGFRAYLPPPAVRLSPDEYEPNDEPSQAKLIEIGTPQQHSFHNPDDIDWVKFQVPRFGRYTIRAKGITSNRLDTYMELFDTNLNLIDEDDDGGEYRDARLSVRLDAGLYYLKVWCLDDEPSEPYTISIAAE